MKEYLTKNTNAAIPRILYVVHLAKVVRIALGDEVHASSSLNLLLDYLLVSALPIRSVLYLDAYEETIKDSNNVWDALDRPTLAIDSALRVPDAHIVDAVRCRTSHIDEVIEDTLGQFIRR